MAEEKCTGNHQVHICELASNNKFDEIRPLVNKPEYICGNCGRVANTGENLCRPISLDDVLPKLSIE